MRAALRLARRALGTTAPNPTVGCVLVREGAVVGQGWTQPGGRPHAEAVALGKAGAAARGATAYVTLEPCVHEGRGPPCADALVEAGAARVVVAAGDPDPRVDGRGLARLRAAGIAVAAGVRRAEAEALMAGFLSRVRLGRPAVTLKLATGIDSRVATRTGESKWITGADSRREVHLLRARSDAILTGVGTVLADDPELTCRLRGLEDRSPLRVVMDSRASTPPTSRIVETAGNASSPGKTPTLAIVTERAGDEATILRLWGDADVEKVESGPDGRVSPLAALKVLAARGINDVLLECGGALAASFLRADLVDRIVWFRAPALVGGDGVAAPGPLGVDALAGAPRFERVSVRPVGADTMEDYRRRDAPWATGAKPVPSAAERL